MCAMDPDLRRRAGKGNGVWDSGANGCDLVNYEVAPGRTSSSLKWGIRR